MAVTLRAGQVTDRLGEGGGHAQVRGPGTHRDVAAGTGAAAARVAGARQLQKARSRS